MTRNSRRLIGSSLLALASAGPLGAVAAHAQDANDAVATTSEEGASARDDAAPAQEEAIVVTGTRLVSGFSQPTPVTVVGAEEIDRQAPTNIGEVLNQVPAFRAQSTAATTAIYASNLGTSAADLRGLGANRTLVLIDGRRVVAATTQGSSFTPANVVDLNMVPTSLVKRTEVVTGGASAQYGSDAVAGVVNIILDTDFSGLRGSAQYGIAEHGDGEEYVASLGYGTDLGDRGHIIIGGEFSDSKGAEDCYSRSWCLSGRNQVRNTQHMTNGVPANNLLPYTINASASQNGIINSGPLAGFEFSEDGQSLVPHDYGTYYGAGLFQSGGGPDKYNAFWEHFPLASPIRRYALLGHADFDVSDTFTLFGELSYADVHGTTTGAQSRDTRITIKRDNPYLPEVVTDAMDAAGSTSFTFGRIGNDLGPGLGVVDRSTFRGVAGLKGDFGDNWHLNAYYQYGRTDYHQEQANTRINDNFLYAVDAVRQGNDIVCRINADSNPANNDPACQPLNLFGQNNFSQAAKDYTYGTAIQDTEISQHVVAATLAGNLVDLWAGPLEVAFGGEYREDSAHGTSDPISAALRFYTSPGAGIDGKVKVKEGFVEAGLPLASTLDLNGAIRVTDYSTSGTVTSWKVGATWEPVPSLRLRATRSRDIRAPNIFELFGPQQSSYQAVSDPQKNGANSLVLTVLGGNPNLKPEIAKTWTVGAVVQPDFWGLDRLRFSVDYYDIVLDDAISTLGSQIIVNLCDQGQTALCDQVVRDSTGIVSISDVNLNLDQLRTNGLDIEMQYTQPLNEISSGLGGTISARVLANHAFHLTTVSPTGDVIDRAGQVGAPVSTPSGVPSWQGSLFLTYADDRLSTTLQVRYISSGLRDVTAVGPDDPSYKPELPNSININHAPAYAYVNLNAQYKIFDNNRQKVEVFGVVNNLLNTDPPNYLQSSFGPTNNVLYDVIGRSYRIGVRFEM